MDKVNAKNLYPNRMWLYPQHCRTVNLTCISSAALPAIAQVAWREAGFGIMDAGAFSVKLLFNSRTANYVHDQHMKITQEGNLILEMAVRSGPEIISWILSFDPGVKVVEPEWLKKEVVLRAQKIVDNC